jgi:hypothetical protein
VPCFTACRTANELSCYETYYESYQLTFDPNESLPHTPLSVPDRSNLNLLVLRVSVRVQLAAWCHLASCIDDNFCFERDWSVVAKPVIMAFRPINSPYFFVSHLSARPIDIYFITRPALKHSIYYLYCSIIRQWRRQDFASGGARKLILILS